MNRAQQSPINVHLLSRVENLSDTAGYLTTLIEIVERGLRELRQHARGGQFATSITLASLGDWDEILTLLRLAGTQVDIVADVAAAATGVTPPVQP